MVEALKKCVLCGSDKSLWRLLFKLNDSQNLVKCKECGLVFNDMRRTDFENVYSDEYFWATEKNIEGGYFNYAMLEKALYRNYKFASSFIKKKIKGKPNIFRLIELGCGCGFFLKQFKDYDNLLDLQGIELNRKAADEGVKMGVNVCCVSVEDYMGSDLFDFIVFFEFIEHVLDPGQIIERVYKLTKPGGYVIISTPDIGSIFFNILKRRWPAIHPGSHNFYFSPATISKLAVKHKFKVISICRSQILWRDVHQLRKRFIELFPWTKYVLKPFAFLDSRVIPFLSGGSMNIILQKGAETLDNSSHDHQK